MERSISARFEIASSAAVLVSIAVMALETFTLPAAVQEALFIADVALSLAFFAEYLYRIAKANNKLGYVTSFYGVVDLVATFPILVHAASSARLLRVLRVIRLLKVKRYNDALSRYQKALKLIAAEAALFTGVTFVFIIGFAFMIYEFEHDAQPELYRNIFNAIW